DELQAELTEDDVELAVAEGKRERAAFDPLDRARLSRDVEHRCVHVEPHDAATVSDVRRGGSRDDARPAGDVEHAVPGPGADTVEKILRPGQRHCRDEVLLVQLGGTPFELPLLRVGGHRAGPATVFRSPLGMSASSEAATWRRMPLTSS